MSVKTQTEPEAGSGPTVPPFRWDLFDKLCDARGWTNDHQRAGALGFSHSHLYRLRSGKVRLGRDVVDKMITGLDVPYEALIPRTGV